MTRDKRRVDRVRVAAVVAAACVLGLPVALSSCSQGHADASTESAATTYASKTEKVSHGRKPDADELLVMRTDDSTSAYGKPLAVDATSVGTELPITLVTEFFSTSRYLFIYVDGDMVEVEEEPQEHTVIRVSGKKLEKGEHTVQAVQYAGDSPAATVTMYKTATYEVS